MRVISGTYKGRILKSVRDPRVRPAADRVKESIFNILQNKLDLRGASVLDLFAGTGSLGFEALSRGAAKATFVDDWKGAIDAIEENAKRLNCLNRCTVVKADVFKFISRTEGLHDLVFVDPPYSREDAADLPALIFTRGLVPREGILIMEHTARLVVAAHNRFELTMQRTFGSTVVSFFTQHLTNS